MKKVVLIPTYNESANLEKLINKISSFAPDLDILIIDDNSPDGTGRLADEFSKRLPTVKTIHRKLKNGLGRAYAEGFLWALDNNYDVIMQMDADLSHEPAVLPKFLEEINHYDAVFGSRYYQGVRVHNWSFRRLLLSKLSNEFVRVMLGINSTDTTTAYKCFRREVIQAIDFSKLKGRQNAFLIELVHTTFKLGFKTKEIPFIFTERESGESKMNLLVAWESLATVFKLFFLSLFGRYPDKRKR